MSNKRLADKIIAGLEDALAYAKGDTSRGTLHTPKPEPIDLDDPLANLELRYHAAIPEWCKIVGLHIRAVPECEDGGFMVRRDQAERIVELVRGIERSSEFGSLEAVARELRGWWSRPRGWWSRPRGWSSKL